MQFNVYLSSAIHIIFFLREVSWVFVVVFIWSVIEITFVFSTRICLRFEIIADTVWLQQAFHLADILIDGVNGSYHVIFKPVTMYWTYGESQPTTLTWRMKILTCLCKHLKKFLANSVKWKINTITIRWKLKSLTSFTVLVNLDVYII